MSEKKNKSPLSEHWFWGSILKSKGTYSQIALASVFYKSFWSRKRILHNDSIRPCNAKLSL